VVDTSRNGVIGVRYNWTEWCNIDYAGFGMRPTSKTGDELADAFLWVKNGGLSDGTSDPSGEFYDPECGLTRGQFDREREPMPARGEWSQEYFEMLLENARPAFREG
jgi:cellulose 1,4-beta-cellobiosidase